VLSDLSPVSSRGRAAIRENLISHSQASALADGNKALQHLSSRFTDTSFGWFNELLSMFKNLSPILEEVVIGADEPNPYSLLRRLCRTAFVCYLVHRCHCGVTTGQVHFVTDLQLLHFLIGDSL
jgi:hypothetical protein